MGAIGISYHRPNTEGRWLNNSRGDEDELTLSLSESIRSCRSSSSNLRRRDSRTCRVLLFTELRTGSVLTGDVGAFVVLEEGYGKEGTGFRDRAALTIRSSRSSCSSRPHSSLMGFDVCIDVECDSGKGGGVG